MRAPRSHHIMLSLMRVLGRCSSAQPDHPESRRLLGFVPYEEGWARPFAISQLRKGKVFHQKYGWTQAAALPNLERGELPGAGYSGLNSRPLAPRHRRRREYRRDWRNGWEINTEHFFIKTNVPFSEAITFGRQVEAFHDLFLATMADVIVEKLPLARRFKDRTFVGETPSPPHQIYYFATRDDFVNHVRPLLGKKAAASLGLYVPPKPGRGRRSPAYFFRHPGSELDVMATLHHEVSHQLL